MKTFALKPIGRDAKFRTLKASALAVLSVVPITAIVGGVLITSDVFTSPHDSDVKEYFGNVAGIIVFALPISSVLMLIFGVPCYHAALEADMFSKSMAITAGIFPPLLIGSIVAILAENIWPILFLLPYGLTITWTFYHLITQPTPNQ